MTSISNGWHTQVAQPPKNVLCQIRKPTRLITNVDAIISKFSHPSAWCDGSHEHVRCSGNEGGQTRASHAAIYPEEFVQALAMSMQSVL